MANGHGGYRRPAHPAPAGSSGPGKFSQRTDGQAVSTVPDQDYGAAKQQAMDQRTQPMAAATPLPKAPSPSDIAEQVQQLPQFQGMDLAGPSQRPDEPVTEGVPLGAGNGPEVLTMPQAPGVAPADGAMTNMLAGLSATDTTGVIAALYEAARIRGV